MCIEYSCCQLAAVIFLYYTFISNDFEELRKGKEINSLTHNAYTHTHTHNTHIYLFIYLYCPDPWSRGLKHGVVGLCNGMPGWVDKGRDQCIGSVSTQNRKEFV